MFDLNENKGKGVEDEYGFYSLASEFKEAAIILNNHITTKLKIDSASIYLICHSAELFLKAFLLKKQGNEEFKNSNYRHNLKKLIKNANANGLGEDLELLLSIAKIYENKKLEYRPNISLKLACINGLIAEVELLSIKAFNVVSSC